MQKFIVAVLVIAAVFVVARRLSGALSASKGKSGCGHCGCGDKKTPHS
jgi:hypothetical protein